MSVDLKQGLDAHPKIARCLKCIDAGLHEPRRRRVAHDMWSILATAYRSPCTPQLMDRLARVMHDMSNPVLAIKSVPAAKMG